MSQNFLVTVADAIIRDSATGEALAYGIANIDSALTITTQATEVRGGRNNPLLYSYIHDRKVEVKITEATFNKTILALNAGTSVLNSSITAVKTDCLVLSASGSGTLVDTPLGDVSVVLPNGLIEVVTPTAKVITTSGGADARVTAIYDYTVTADQITFETIKPPSVVDLTLIAEERDNTGVIQNYVQINIPSFQVTGNYTLSFAANGVSNQALEGSALAVASSDCATGEYYAKVTWVAAADATPGVLSLAASPATLSFSVAAGLPKTKQITLWGIRGGLFSNVNVTTSASSIVTSGSTTLVANYNVGLHTGAVTAGSAVAAGWLATVTASYVDADAGLLHDTVDIVATA